jgi:hypothetical protein
MDLGNPIFHFPDQRDYEGQLYICVVQQDKPSSWDVPRNKYSGVVLGALDIIREQFMLGDFNTLPREELINWRMFA